MPLPKILRALAPLLVSLAAAAPALAAPAPGHSPPARAPGRWPSTPAPGRSPSTVAPGRYINPFGDPRWQPSRTDMGVDWAPTLPLPVLAVGNAVILGSDSHASWPGHHIIWYRLLDGSHAGDVIYVAEHLKHLAPAGKTVRAGQKIAIALPGYPWTEWGWANPDGSPLAYPCYREGKQTRSGKEMARFLARLGAQLAYSAGSGPDGPTGRRCY